MGALLLTLGETNKSWSPGASVGPEKEVGHEESNIVVMGYI